jgi:hypothetical protein
MATARLLARQFPENRELRRFLTTHDPTALDIKPRDGGDSYGAMFAFK